MRGAYVGFPHATAKTGDGLGAGDGAAPQRTETARGAQSAAAGPGPRRPHGHDCELGAGPEGVQLPDRSAAAEGPGLHLGGTGRGRANPAPGPKESTMSERRTAPPAGEDFLVIHEASTGYYWSGSRWVPGWGMARPYLPLPAAYRECAAECERLRAAGEGDCAPLLILADASDANRARPAASRARRS